MLLASARLDLAPLLGQAERATGEAVRGLFPPGARGTVKVEPVHVLAIGIAGGSVWARCRVTGSISPLGT
jgi:hypothetical protein